MTDGNMKNNQNQNSNTTQGKKGSMNNKKQSRKLSKQDMIIGIIAGIIIVLYFVFS